MSENTASPAAASSDTPTSTENTENESKSTEATSNADASGSSDKDTSNDSTKKPSSAKEKASNKKNLKLKVDGEEYDEEIDFDNEEDLIKKLQYSKVAQKRMQEKATLEKQMGAFLELLQSDPEKAMREIGMDPEDFAVKTLQRKIEDDQKTPEQKELEKLKRELEEHRSKSKQQEDERKNAEIQRHQQEQEKKIEEGMLSALEKHKLPNEPLVVKRMAELMLICLDEKIDLDPHDVAAVVKKELEDDMRKYISVLPDEAIEAILGKERLVGMRKKQIAAVKKAAETANSVKSTGNDVKPKENSKKTSPKLSMSNFLRS